MTLHEAIQKVLIDSRRSMTATDIAVIINGTGLYKRSDNNPIPASQISARVNNYPEMFEKNGKLISLFHIGEVQVQFALMKVLDSQWGELKHVSESFSNVLTIPLSFFFKRVIDNPDLLENIFHKNLLIVCNYKGFVQFLGYLEESYPDLKSTLPGLIEELNNEQNKKLEKLLSDLADIDLRRNHLPDKVFSELYINIIGIVAKRDFTLGLFSTPDTLAELIARLALLYPFKSLYNPGAGIGTLPSALKKINPDGEFFFTGEEINPQTYLLAFTNLVINNININEFHLKDSLLNPLKMKFDLMVCNPPVNAILPNKHGWPELGHTNKSHLVFLGSILSKLKSKGRAIILMPENFLFSQDSVEKEYKRYLLKYSLIEGIISLPAGLFHPLSGIKTSLLVMNSNKINEFTYLIDAENLNLRNRPEKNEIHLESEKIIKIIKSSFNNLSKHEMEGQLSEPAAYYHSDYFTVKNLNPADLNLSVKRYLVEDNPDADTKNWFRLGDVFDHYWNKTEGIDSRYINTSDLNSNYFDYRIDIKKLQNENKPGCFLDKNAILIGSVAGSYKPSFFEASEPVVVSPNIYVMIIKPAFEGKVLPEYLIYELAGKSFTEKLNRLATGSTTLKRVSKADLLNARIYIPSIEEQESILNTKKETIINLKTNEVSALKDLLNLSEKALPDYLGFIEHELGNVAGGVNNNIKVLDAFIKNLNIDPETRVSALKNSSTVSQVFESLESNMNDISNLLESVRKILDISASPINLTETGYRDYLNSELQKQADILKDVEVLIGVDDVYDNNIEVQFSADPNLFSLVIRNFIINSVRHGFSKAIENRIILFNLTHDDDYYYLNMINNGDPFPEGFNHEDFAKFGKRAGSLKGSGLGGFIMNEVVKKHNGILSVISGNDLMQIKSKNELKVVRKSIHFQIQLPKNN